MYDSDESGNPGFSPLSAALIVGTIAAGFVTAIATGGFQVAAFAATLVLWGGSIAANVAECRACDRKQAWPDAQEDATVTRLEIAMAPPSQQQAPAPEKNWVASISKSQSIGRYH